jgi:hypothetical protein
MYVVYATFNNETFYSLLNPKMSEGSVNLMVGKQLGDYPAKTCVDLSEALQAAEVFAETGQLAETLVWEEA